jgi:1,4-alpha-glucan branching enzyme
MKNKGTWKEIFNSDNQAYWGTDQYKNEESLQSKIDKDKRHHLLVQLPPLAGIVLKKVD